MKLILFLVVLLGGGSLWADSLRLIGKQEISSSTRFEKSRIGGLSGLVWDPDEKLFWAVSDDRGTRGEPRVYAFSFSEAPEPQLKPAKLLYLKDAKNIFRVFDFEGVTLLPWGNLLVSSEGDMNKKPRVQPGIFEFKKKNGELVRSYDLPSEYLAEDSGRQTKGVRNNFAFEGLTSVGSVYFAATELPLVQDKANFARILQFDQSEAWQLKAGQEWLYPLPEAFQELAAVKASSKDFNIAITGVSEIQSVRENVLWVLERTAGLNLHGVGLASELYEVEFPKTKTESGIQTRELKKKKIFDFDTVVPANFEGMALGPTLKNGKRLFVVISDNNFESKTPTRILFFEVEP